MPKQKKEPFSKTNKTNLFSYEISGIIIIVLSFFAVAKLGKLGFYLNLIFRLLFGDWSFLFICLLICIGFYFLFMHQRLPFTSLAMLGFCLIFISLITLSHFSMDEYVINYSNSLISTTLSLYLDYFKNGSSSSMVGGGIIGMFIFYLMYYLLSKPGVIIISIAFIILGLCFISKHTLNDCFYFIMKIIKKILAHLSKILKKVKKNIRKYGDEYGKKVSYKLNKNFIEKVDKESRYFVPLEEYENKIRLTLNKMCVFHYTINSYQTPNLLVFIIDSFLRFNVNQFEKELMDRLNIAFLIKEDEINKTLIIEITNPFIYKLTLDDILTHYVQNKFVFTIDDQNNPIYLDHIDNRLLMFNKESDVFLFYIIEVLLINKDDCFLFDLNKRLSFMEKYVADYYNSEDDLDEIIKQIELFIKEEDNSCRFYMIDLNGSLDLEPIFQKLRYCMEISKDHKIFFIIQIDDIVNKNNYFYNEFSYLLDVDITSKNVLNKFGFTSSVGMQIGSEFLVLKDDLVIRTAALYLQEKELDKLKNIK